MNQLKLRFGGFSNAGIKDENQDAMAAFQPTGSLLEYKGAVATIADGVSTSAKGKEAAATCATNFIHDYLDTPDTWSVERSAAQIIRSLNSWCFAQGSPTLDHHQSQDSNYLTTFSTVICRGAKASIFHVGDSRVYRLQDRSLEQLTRDHKQRQGEQSYLTRAIGIDSHIDVDLSSVDIRTGDLFVLTTDGVHEFLSHKEIQKTLNLSHITLEAKAQSLVQLALDKGSNDNVSCLCMKIENLPLQNMDEFYKQASTLVIPPPLNVGNKLEGYKVLEVLFEGTRSHVYKVLCLDTKNLYALKTPTRYFSDDEVFLRGFVKEQWVGNRIEHSNIMRIFPRKPDSQFLYHVCELIDGQTLRQWMIDNPKPSLDKVRSIIQSVVSALRKMQRLDLVHRDLKPENIMITLDGKVKLVDFGTFHVASVTPTREELETPVGSVNYIAPETVLNNKSDHQSDIFSLGVIVYEMLTNELPFKPFPYKDYRPKSLSEWNYIPLHQTTTDLPNWVDMTLRKVCYPNPNNRYDSFSEFLSDLTKPNEVHLSAIKNAPLIERHPIRFWQVCTGLLLLINLIQFLILFS